MNKKEAKKILEEFNKYKNKEKIFAKKTFLYKYLVMVSNRKNR